MRLQKLIPIVVISALLSVGNAVSQERPADTRSVQQIAGANLQRVRVILADSEGEIDGRLLALDDTTLRILVSGKSWDLPLSDVQQVDVERKDSLKNGAAIGALILGGWCLAVCGQALPSASQLLPAVVSNAAFGALVGAGIDAARRERTTIYPLRLTTRALQSAPRLAMSYRWYF